ncbi:right-handed parallel beta-helix repeat-containing protein [Draconibacterium sp. IB214405]|uniref:right-handed parallel beta-helix repeat-containing protein n=1 Tax=Draconibacterium sp. IB214405 TaxID=3097352 RepID=UPI002A15B83D|nr:right-handed parallel beta-helix repeat-containing protein [Draconibacterium sp. IB214405]MDX8339285.1 right-handed parallel beta-helix repeat-containing protein [Draconibacterium sp. IB214405]
MKRILLILFVTTSVITQVVATNVSGDITNNTTWTAANSPYIITTNVLVHDTARLVIEAGVQIKVDAGFQLSVDGELEINGTEASPVVFTSNSGYPQAGDWKGIIFNDASDEGRQSIVNHVKISYVIRGMTFADVNVPNYVATVNGLEVTQFSEYGIYTQNASPVISDILITNTGLQYQKGTGIYSNGEPAATFSGGKVESCSKGIYIYASSPKVMNMDISWHLNQGIEVYSHTSNISPEITFCTVSGNSGDGIYLHAYSTSNPGPNAIINNCNIMGNNGYGLKTYVYQNASTIWLDATNNWWGTSDPTEINDMIYDYHENTSASYVDFVPFLDAEGGNSYSGNYKLGPVENDEVWNSAAVLVGNVMVNNNNTLSISAGTQVKVDNDGKYSFVVDDGKLTVSGTEASPVVFTSNSDYPQAGDWKGIVFNGASDDGRQSTVSNVKISYVTRGLTFADTDVPDYVATVNGLEVTQFSEYGIYTQNASPVISDILITNTGLQYQKGTGIYSNGEPAATFSGGKVESCSKGIYIYASSPKVMNMDISWHLNQGIEVYSHTSNISPEITFCTVSGNSGDGIYLHAYSTSNPGPNAIINNCNIMGNNGYGLKTYVYQNASTIWLDATNNWWGTSDPTEINDMIYDYQDNTSSANVSYDPYSLEEITFVILPADFNVDGSVNGFDLAQFAVAFGSTPELDNWNEPCDLNSSGMVDGFDLAIFATYFGQSNLKSSYTHPFYALNNLKSEHLTNLKIKAEPTDFRSNNEFSVFVTADEIKEAIGLAFQVNYDREMFELLAVIQYNDIEGKGENIFLSQIDQDKGQVTIGLASLDNTVNGLDGSGTVCELKFKSKTIKLPLSFKFSNAGLMAMDGTTKLGLNTTDFQLNLTDIGSIDEPGVFALGQNYPNPFSEQTKIQFRIPTGEAKKVKLAVYNLAGQELDVIFQGTLDPGVYNYEYSRYDAKGGRLPGGIYYLNLTDGEYQLSRKMVVLPK